MRKESPSPAGIWSWHPSSGRLSWSLAHFRIFGLDPALTEITCDRFFQMVHPEDRDRLVCEFEAAVQAKRELDAEYRIVRPDGSIRYILGRGQALCVAFDDT